MFFNYILISLTLILVSIGLGAIFIKKGNIRNIFKYSYIIISTLFALLGVFSCSTLIDMFFGYSNDKKENSKQEIFATFEKPAVSPSGKYQLQVVKGSDGVNYYYSFHISEIRKGNRPNVVFSSTYTIDSVFVSYFLWDDSDRLWVYNGDTSTSSYWIKKSDNSWEKIMYKDENVPFPNLLKKITRKK